ncbi:hypothetical protein RvY_07572-2 [Ramazzottius varieornatus]|uniref:Uncharacterized protein n=1 Tax=Ramazzottius varieornatus TaxID=947166 RepID=A0A1D1V5A0_RAMVA|nr:hypothetical protein RvY_07572-2 [Ramazzottius varieornatus]
MTCETGPVDLYAARIYTESSPRSVICDEGLMLGLNLQFPVFAGPAFIHTGAPLQMIQSAWMTPATSLQYSSTYIFKTRTNTGQGLTWYERENCQQYVYPMTRQRNPG